jgi:hypothetical protein
LSKLPALVDRFRKHTVQIWKRHDIRPVGFWTVDSGENTNDLLTKINPGAIPVRLAKNLI